MERERIRTVLADDHPVFRHGVADLLVPEVDVVASVDDGAAAVAAVEEHRPDLVILDLAMPSVNGVAAVRRIMGLGRPPRCMMLSVYESRVYVEQALGAGARGYVLKRSAFQNILQAVRAVHAGGVYLDPALTWRGAGRRAAAAECDASSPELSDREGQVLRLVAFGFTSKEIADQLSVTTKAVESQKARACAKLGIASRAQVVQFAMLQGWLQGEIPVR
jgi:DNA-binding NarL/FixJ family response regulator